MEEEYKGCHFCGRGEPTWRWTCGDLIFDCVLHGEITVREECDDFKLTNTCLLETLD